MKTGKLLSKAVILGAVLLTAACASQTESRLENRYETRVDFARFGTAIDTDETTGAVTEAGQREAVLHLGKLRAGYGDVVIVRGGSDTGRKMLIGDLQSGYPNVEFVAVANVSSGLDLTLERAIATPPACGDWSAPSGSDASNTGGLDLGCATAASLGLMVADPRDLLGGSAPGPEGTDTGIRAIAEQRSGPLVLSPQTEVTGTTE